MGRKRKQRVAFRKNRQKRSRQGDLTRDAREGGLDQDFRSGERVGKDETTRHRTVIVEEGEAGTSQRDVDAENCLSGRVINAVGLNCFVRGEDGADYECSVRRVVRTMARDGRNAVVTGDRVLFQPVAQRQGVIERVEPRHGTISRRSNRHEHVLVANVDQVLIVASAADPQLKPNLIDRFLISASKGATRAILCINKIDLAAPADLQPIAGLYASLGYDVVLTSAQHGTGLDQLRAFLNDQQTVVTGQSGVGKSSLLNAVQPGLQLEVGEVAEDSRKGTHTTRSARLLELQQGGWVVDTPGIRQLDLWDVSPGEVEFYFVEFRPFVTLCRFPDCTHTHESGCGVKRAVASDLITRQRYESYRKLLLGD